MLKYLKIKNIAIINESKIEFTEGFNCLTGETGAGKSIIIDSLNFVLGAKTDKNLINTNSDFAQVDAVFDYDKENLEFVSFLKSISIDEGDDILISRNLTSSGKNTYRINGDLTTQSIIKKLSSFLIDVFGQGDNQFLLNSNNHLTFLDDYINQNSNDLNSLKNKLVLYLNDLKNINIKIKDLGGVGIDKEKNIEILKYQINEIEEAQLEIGDDEKLFNRKKVLLNSEKIFNSLSNAIDEMQSKDIVNSIKQSCNYLKSVEEFSENISLIKDSLIDLKYNLEDYIESLKNEKSNINYSEYELNEIEEKIDLINDMKRKYGNSIEDILNKHNDFLLKLNELENNEILLKENVDEKKAILNQITNIAKNITKLRKDYSIKFEASLKDALIDLGLENSKFKIEFKNNYDIDNIESLINQNGADKIEFLFSANLGQELKPLAKVLSGGEMSRFMLAFKSIISSNEKYKTFIFDEIDTGIGGKIGSAVGKKITNISIKNQVLCITHLAQIACFANTNFKIEKNIDNNKTIATVQILNKENKILEIARMIGVLDNNIYAKKHAEEIINEANNYRKLILETE